MEEAQLHHRLVATPQVTLSGLSEAELETIAPMCRDSAPTLWRRLRKKIRCSGPIAKSLLLKFIPVLHWLPRYRVKEWLLGDIMSGLSVGIMQLPQGLAYALLASVPAVFGLYSSFYPVLLYSIFGTSRHISAGTFSIIAVMIGSVTESMAPNENFMLPGNETVLDVAVRDQARVDISVALNFLVGIFQIVLGLLQFGFVVTYLSEPLVRGYTTAASIHVTVSQMKNLFGLRLSQTNQPLSLIYLFVATGISYGAQLHAQFGIAIVGDIPVGMRPPSVPDSSLFGNLVGNAFAVAVVTYAFTISVCKMFAMKHAYKVDSNQELIALGLCNLFGSFFQCFTIGTAMSRSLVQENTGGNTQLVGIIASLVILAIILKAGELFVHLPKAVLSAIVIANLQGMYKQFADIQLYWSTNQIDLLVWAVTFVATILLNMDVGLVVSVVFALLTVIFKTQLPHYSILGQIPETAIYRDIAEYPQAKEIPGVKIFRSSATLHYANADLYTEALKAKCGFSVDELIEQKKKAIKKLKKDQEEAEKQAKKEQSKKEQQRRLKKENSMDYMAVSNGVVLELEDKSNKSPNTAEEATLKSMGLAHPPFNSLILDLTAVSSVDSVSVKVLKNIFKEFAEIEVNVYLIGCQESVIRQLEMGNLFSKVITKAKLFPSVHDAVTCLSREEGQFMMQEIKDLSNTRM